MRWTVPTRLLRRATAVGPTSDRRLACALCHVKWVQEVEVVEMTLRDIPHDVVFMDAF